MPIKIEIRGDIELRKALRKFAPDLENTLRKQIGAVLRPVVRQARGFVPAQSPMSGWASRSYKEGKFPTYSASTIIAGITYSAVPGKKNANGFRSMASVLNKSRVGAIYEGAGRLNNGKGQPWVGPKAGGSSNKVSHSSNPKAGEQFIKNLPDLSSSLKGRGRLIYRAWGNNLGKAEGAVNKAVSEALSTFRARSANKSIGKAA